MSINCLFIVPLNDSLNTLFKPSFNKAFAGTKKKLNFCTQERHGFRELNPNRLFTIAA